jgi:hypothetical protein
MGVTNLLPELRPYMLYMSLAMLEGKVVGLDVSLLLHLLLQEFYADITAPVQRWDGLVRAFRKTIINLLATRCTLIAVLDGRRVDAKIANKSRTERRDRAMTETACLQLSIASLRAQIGEVSERLKDSTRQGASVDEDLVEQSASMAMSSAWLVPSSARMMVLEF